MLPTQETKIDGYKPSHNVTIKRAGPYQWKSEKTYYRQKKPYSKPLPYRLIRAEMKFQFFGTAAKANSQVDCMEFYNRASAYDSPMAVSAHNKALTKVHDQLRIADSFFEDWYERKQAYELIHSAGKHLYQFLTGWRKPHYWKKLRKDARPKDFPSAWLAYQFGVQPLIGGIDRAMNLLGQDFPAWTIHGTSGFNGEFSEIYRSPSLYHFVHFRGDKTGIVKIGCQVTGVNGNKALVGATGLNEPFSSAWNVIPWGWAVDYFINIGDLLSNIELKHPGLYTANWYRTQFTKTNSHVTPAYDPSSSEFKAWSHDCSVSAFFMQRTLSQSLYLLEFKFPPLGGNKQANLFSAIALTASGLKKH